MLLEIQWIHTLNTKNMNLSKLTSMLSISVGSFDTAAGIECYILSFISLVEASINYTSTILDFSTASSSDRLNWIFIFSISCYFSSTVKLYARCLPLLLLSLKSVSIYFIAMLTSLENSMWMNPVFEASLTLAKIGSLNFSSYYYFVADVLLSTTTPSNLKVDDLVYSLPKLIEVSSLYPSIHG